MIFSYIYTAVLILICLIVQGHPSFDVIRIAGVKPDLIFILVIFSGYSFGSFYGEVTGFISGLFHDSISNSPLGLLAFPKMIMGFVIGMLGRSLIKSNLLTITLLLFVASIFKGVITLMICYVFHEARVTETLGIILPESFYNAILAPPLFFIFDKIFQYEIEKGGNP
jgi:rod shape-determining protein MreD